MARHSDRMTKGIDAELLLFLDCNIDGKRVFHGGSFLGEYHMGIRIKSSILDCNADFTRRQ